MVKFLLQIKLNTFEVSHSWWFKIDSSWIQHTWKLNAWITFFLKITRVRQSWLRWWQTSFPPYLVGKVSCFNNPLKEFKAQPSRPPPICWGICLLPLWSPRPHIQHSQSPISRSSHFWHPPPPPPPTRDSAVSRPPLCSRGSLSPSVSLFVSLSSLSYFLSSRCQLSPSGAAAGGGAGLLCRVHTWRALKKGALGSPASRQVAAISCCGCCDADGEAIASRMNRGSPEPAGVHVRRVASGAGDWTPRI